MTRAQATELAWRSVALTVMAGCLAFPLAHIVTRLIPAAHGRLIIWACGLAALEANYSAYLLRRQLVPGAGVWRYRATEFGAYFIALKIVHVALVGWPIELTGPGPWPTDVSVLIGVLFDFESLALLGLAVLVALAVNETLDDLDRTTEAPDFEPRGVVPPLDNLTGRFFTGGMVLLVLSGLERISLQEFFNLERPPVVGLVANVLLYFLVGLVLLGRARLSLLSTLWQAQGVRVPPELPARWVRYSLVFVGLAAVLALALPTGYTSGALGFIGAALQLISGLLLVLTSVLLGLLLLPVALLMAVLGPNAPLRIPRLPPPPLPALGQSLPSVPWMEALRPLLVWGLVVAMVAYVLYSYIHDRPELLRSLRAAAPWRALRRLWAALRHRLSGLAAAAGDLSPIMWLRQRLQRPGAADRLGFFRLGAASPREQVLFYYLSLVRRAGEKGLRRHPAQTPSEYQVVVSAGLPDVQPEVAQLTSAFIVARYSGQPVDTAHAQQARAVWVRLRTALRNINQKAHQPPKARS